MPPSSYLQPLADPDTFRLAQAYRGQPEAVLDALRAVQARHGTLTLASIEAIAAALNQSAAQVYGVATFYSLLQVGPAAAARRVARVCDGPVCWLKGAGQASAALPARLGPAWRVESASCLGLCDQAPAALMDGQPVGHPRPNGFGGYGQARPGEVRVLLARAGQIDPDSLFSARKRGAYAALEAALQHPPAAVIAEIEAAGLTGRGGAAFPTARKWQMAAQAGPGPKYIVCNADESEPLTFKDRVLIDTDPHQVLEGMALAGYAVGARAGLIYIRGEYEPQAQRLERAIRQAEAAGLLGAGLFGTSFDFHIDVHRGAGAYICGEETALLESLEGRRGQPRVRPPYPTTHGYHGRPTVVNNVETLAAVPNILARGAAWWRSLSSAGTPGTRLYLVLGHVQRPGLFEAPFGLTLRQIVEEFGGGLPDGAAFHFALTGGAAGSVVPPGLLDEVVGSPDVSLGAGGVLVCDQSVSVVALVGELLRFFERESCGQCTPCRVGTRQARVILDRLVSGDGRPGDLSALGHLARLLSQASQCGLGTTAALPLQSALRHFEADFVSAERLGA